MAGTIVGLSNAMCGPNDDSVIPYTSYPVMMFYAFWRFMDLMIAEGYATRIASNYGTTQYGTPGNGIGYPTDATGFGTRCFGVWRMNGTGSGNAASSRSWDYYIVAQGSFNYWDSGTPYGPVRFLATQGTTGLDGLGFDMAFREDGGNPWNGTTNDNGADSRGSPTWTDGGVTTLHVMNYSNGASGSYSTLKENLAPMTGLIGSANHHILHFAGDADSFVAVQSSPTLDPTYAYGGVYIPRAGFSPTYPLVMYAQRTTGVNAGPFGTPAGNGNYEGGIWIPGGVVPYYVGYDGPGIHDNAGYHPNNLFNPPRVMELPILIGTTATAGHPGTFDPNLFCQTQIHQYTIGGSGTRAYFGTSGYSAARGIPWGDTVGINHRRDRAGVSF